MPEVNQTEMQETRVPLLVRNVKFWVKKNILSETKFFEGILSDEWPKKDGDFFVIDRPATYFPVILRYLKGEKEDFFGWSWKQLTDLAHDADFYSLPELSASIDDLVAISDKPESVSIPEERRIEIFTCLDTLMDVMKARKKHSFVFRSRNLGRLFENFQSMIDDIDRTKNGVFVLVGGSDHVDVILASPWTRTLPAPTVFKYCGCQSHLQQLESALRRGCSIKFDEETSFSGVINEPIE